MVVGLNSVCNHTSDNKIGRPRSGSPICLSRVPINHKNYNFWEKQKSQVMKERKKLHQNTNKGDVKILRPPCLLPAIRRQKHKGMRARVTGTLNAIGWLKLQLWMWLAYWTVLITYKLSNNKLSNKNLVRKLVENRSLLKPITIEEIVILWLGL